MPIRIARAIGRWTDRLPWMGMEFWSGVSALGWATLSLCTSGELTDRPSWAWLARLYSPPFWEGAGLIVGALQISALYSRTHFPRWITAWLASCWWALLTISIAIFDHAAPSIVVYGCLSAANLVAMGRAAHGVKASGEVR